MDCVKKAGLGLLALVLAVLALALAASHLGGVHPAGDSLAVARPVLVVAVLGLGAVLALTRWRRFGVVALLGALVAAMPLAMAVLRADPAPQGDVIRVYAKNLWAGNTNTRPLVADILETGADIVLLQELGDVNRRVLEQLAPTHPHRHVCRFSGRIGIAVVSRWPLEDGRCTPARAAAAARVMTPQGPVWAVAVHLPWPYPYQQAERAAMVRDLLDGMQGDVLIGGDFNMMPWGHSVRSVAAAVGARGLGPHRPTFDLRGYPLILDQILTTGTGRVETRDRLGSDHRGVLAEIAF